MEVCSRCAVLVIFGLLVPGGGRSMLAQAAPPGAALEDPVAQLFDQGNRAMDAGKFADARVQYELALAQAPATPGILYNAGLSCYLAGDFAAAVRHWSVLAGLDPADWQTLAKLIQANQAAGDLTARDEARARLFALRASGKVKDLSGVPAYCRDQFEAGGRKVMVFEHFELTGERKLRYVFAVLDATGEKEAFRISLGSYDMTNAVWRETTKPEPKAGERLFHLDGYYEWGHATHGMFHPEPSYDQVRLKVVEILENKNASLPAPQESVASSKEAP